MGYESATGVVHGTAHLCVCVRVCVCACVCRLKGHNHEGPHYQYEVLQDVKMNSQYELSV